MLLPLITGCAVFVLLSFPGWMLVANRGQPLWLYVASGFCAQTGAILITSVIALAFPSQIDVRYTLLTAILWSAYLYARRHPRPPGLLPTFDRFMWLVPAVATLTAAIIFALGIKEENGDLIVRAWFNADGFKHLGHVNAVAELGLPVRDIFGDWGNLGYYWFYYVVPGISAAIHGDSASALIVNGLIQTFTFWIIVHGLLRTLGASPSLASALALIGWLSPSLDGITALFRNDFYFWHVANEMNIESFNTHMLGGSTLFRLSLYIPQHQFMLAGLLSWSTIYIYPNLRDNRAIQILAVSPIVCAGAISTLFGAACVTLYSIINLLDRHTRLTNRIMAIFSVGLASIFIPLIFGIIGTQSDTNGLSSPIFDANNNRFSIYIRILLSIPGILFIYGGTFLLGYYGLIAGWRKYRFDHENSRMFNLVFTLCLGGIAILIASTMLNQPRLAQELQLRASFFPYIGFILAGTWLYIQNENIFKRHWNAIGILTGLLLGAGMATPLLDSIWHGTSTEQWIVRIPADDRKVLAFLKKNSSPDSVTLQYPELPFVSRGRDTWVPIIAGRSVYTSYRATEWKDHQDRVKLAKKYYSDLGSLPEGKYQYVYLSRRLHPDTYDTLFNNLRMSPEWTLDISTQGASIFERKSNKK